MEGKVKRFFDKYNWWRLLAWILIVYAGIVKYQIDRSILEAIMNSVGIWAIVQIGVKMNNKDNDLTWGE